MYIMYLPYDIELIIYRYLHELNMIPIRKELKETMVFIEDCINFFRLYIPKLFMERFTNVIFLKIRFLVKPFINTFIPEKCLAVFLN
jgi:hypothetical protein